MNNNVNVDILIGKDDTEPSVPSKSDYLQVYVGQAMAGMSHYHYI